jgi:hypothetical protein
MTISTATSKKKSLLFERKKERYEMKGRERKGKERKGREGKGR